MSKFTGTEVAKKILVMREWLKQFGAVALRFSGSDWFAWATGGASNVVLLSAESGIAEVLVTKDSVFILTNDIEIERLRAEEIPAEFEVLRSSWWDLSALDRMARDIAGDGVILADRPKAGELSLPLEIRQARLALGPEEQERYRKLGSEAAQAMTEALSAARPDWTENHLAGEGAKALWSRGIHPTLILVAGVKRFETYRHPFPSNAPLGDRAMMVFCGRRHGLFANLTRVVSFREPSQEENEKMEIVAKIEAKAWEKSRPGVLLLDVFAEIKRAYEAVSRPRETDRQHFGGLTGYLSRESFALPAACDREEWRITEGSALAWNPTLPGAKIEDTMLVTKDGPEVLTFDPAWPNGLVNGQLRPKVWVRS